jgi:hypothetical protein
MSAQPTQQQMSITQALAELKLIRKRFEKVLKDAKFTTVKTKSKQVDIEEFNREAKASYQSFRDLVSRYNKIKAAIVISNATATVTVAGKQYSIAEAVERKRSIEVERNLLNSMRAQWNYSSNEVERHQEIQQERLDKMLLQELGKDSKTSVEVVTALTETFMKNNKAELIDPLGLATKIKELSDELDNFETNVDWVLSESNGRTIITV